MNDLPAISVVIPSYNHVRYVEAAIRSVDEQERRGFTLEIIVVDDGSSDGSVELLRSLRDSGRYQFKLVVKDNEGVCRTLNRGIREHSSGRYISIIASDDLWHPEKLSKQLAELLRNPDSSLCYSNARTFGENHKGGWKTKYMFSGRYWLTIYNFIPAGTMIFSRELFDQIGGFDETGLKLEDWDFLLRASAVTRFCRVDEGLLYYRVHDQSALAKMRAKGTLFSEKMKVLRKNRGITVPVLRALSTCLHFMLDRVLRPGLSAIGVTRS